MRLALIPPFAHVGSIMHTDYQMVLPGCTDSERYRNAYHRARKAGHYLILDNGEAEGSRTSSAALHRIAQTMMVHEIVVPDTIGNLEATLAQAQAFQSQTSILFNYMGVVQGQTIAECRQCIDMYAEAPYITTIGIPRNLITAMDVDARYYVARYARNMYDDRFQIHLLGTNPEYIREVEEFGRAYRRLGVRGVDTSAPYNYALVGSTLLEGKTINRPDNYFDQRILEQDRNVMHTNLAIIKDWVYGNAARTC